MLQVQQDRPGQPDQRVQLGLQVLQALLVPQVQLDPLALQAQLVLLDQQVLLVPMVQPDPLVQPAQQVLPD